MMEEILNHLVKIKDAHICNVRIVKQTGPKIRIEFAAVPNLSLLIIIPTPVLFLLNPEFTVNVWIVRSSFQIHPLIPV